MPYETVIGLETHAQLLTESKMFCSCANKFGGPPNTNICPICTGQPGVLPVTNKKAIELAIKTAIALNCKVEPASIFARKHYFYPDLPKDFQISQYEEPLATGGYLEIEVDGRQKRIGITRVHLEEDAGKLVHVGAARIMGAEESLVDYNRTGTPLMEIVSEPDIRSPKEAAIFSQALANLLQYIGVCDAKMEEGSLRCDANLSVREAGSRVLGVKTEVKNMNSFKAIEKALLAEEKRHIETLAEGGKIVQETRFYDDVAETTTGMRGKEFAHDYRYFPEPDLVPIEPTAEWIELIRQTIGELPAKRQERYLSYGLSSQDVDILISNHQLSSFFEAANGLYNSPKTICNLIIKIGLASRDLKANNLTPATVAETSKLIDAKTLSWTLAVMVLNEVQATGKTVQDVIKEKGLSQISNEGEIEAIARAVIKNHPKVVEEYKGGKKTAIMFLVGQVMKQSKGRANPAKVNELLSKLLT